MKFELKALSPDAVPRALAKAERYRLRNEPREAESICLDAIAREPENQQALQMLLLVLTDQFRQGASPTILASAREVVARLRDEYDRLYYTGIICERQAKACLQDAGRPFELLREAMLWYERAEAIRPAGNDDAVLRWNTCARLIMRELS